MDNSLITRSNSEMNVQNNLLYKDRKPPKSSEINTNFKFFSVKDLDVNLFSSLNLNRANSNVNSYRSPQKQIKRYNSEKIKKFLAEEEQKKPLGPIKEILIDDQNEQMVSNNPKKRFMINKEKKNDKKEKTKLDFIEELRDFDRRQRISMEEYINNIKKQKFDMMYKKTLKNKYEELNYLSGLNNGIFNEVNNSNILNTPAEKEIDEESEDLDDSFEKMKKKYFSKTIFSSQLPNSEYKVKYLDNYFKNDSVVKNLFAQYKAPQKDKTDINNININTNNEHNNNDLSPTTICNVNFNTSINNSSAYKPPVKLNSNINFNEIKGTKLVYKNNLEGNNADNLNMNNRYSNASNVNDKSLKVNQNSIASNKYINSKYKNPKNDEIENKYNEVLNSINEKLYKNKYKKKMSDIEYNNYLKNPSSDRIKMNSNLYKNDFKIFLLDKNKSYNFFRDRIDNQYNNLKLKSNIFFRNSNIPRMDFYK